MKKLLLVIGTLLSLSAAAQDNGTVSEKENMQPKFSSETLKFNDLKNQVELSGQVDFKTDMLHIENAEKVIFDQTTGEIVATGIKKYSFIGTTQVKNKAQSKILRYTIGDKIAYLE